MARQLGLALSCAVIVVAPLAVGGVHRVPMVLLMMASAGGLACLAAGAALEGRPLRVGMGVLLPLTLLAVPLLQSLPLPLAFRGMLDPNGNALLTENELLTARLWPLSLDPAVTRVQVGKAAAAVAAFIVAFHLASGKRIRHFIPRLVAIAGIVAVAVGLGHKILSIPDVYGVFRTNFRSMLTGPFVNSNHNAEFLELAMFTCLGCSFQRNNALNRYGWLTGALFCGAGAIATLSRGSIVGVLAGAGAFVVLRALSRDDGPRAPRGVAFAWGIAASLLVLGMAGVLGAGALIDRFRTTPIAHDLRFELWRDSLRVLAAHPAGIGRGAFEHLFPVYRTISNGLTVTFAFVENEPLQLLIDSGWLLFGVIVASGVVVVRHGIRRARRDKVEAAYIGGLVAVLAHNTVDFGLETMGVLLPFMAIFGTVTGRGVSADDERSKAKPIALVAVTCASLVFGVVALAHPSSRDFDKLLAQPRPMEEARSLLREAQRVHPTDYFYALAYARTEPLKLPSGGRSPRMHALNHALRLCQNCDLVHEEVARNLWQLGSRGQAITEWRTALRLQPLHFPETLKELARVHATPRQLAALASDDPRKMLEVADFLAARSLVNEATQVLDQADVMGAPREESLLTRARLQLQAKKVPEAQATLAEAHAAGIRDVRLSLLEAQMVDATKGAAGADETLAILDLAAAREPLDLPIQRMRVQIVSAYRKWKAVDRAIDGLKLALYHEQGSAVEANVQAARIRSQLSQWTAAVSEYRVALGQVPGDLGLWLEFGGMAEHAGRETMAREAYSEASRLAPSDSRVVDALARLEARRNAATRSVIERRAMGGD